MNKSVFEDKCNIINLCCQGLLPIIKTTKGQMVYIYYSKEKVDNFPKFRLQKGYLQPKCLFSGIIFGHRNCSLEC